MLLPANNTNINNNVHYELICPPNIESEWYATECLPDANIRTLLSKITVPNIDLIRAKERSACDPLLIQCFNHNIVKVNDIEIDGLTHFVPQQRPDLIINMCNDFFSSFPESSWLALLRSKLYTLLLILSGLLCGQSFFNINFRYTIFQLNNSFRAKLEFGTFHNMFYIFSQFFIQIFRA